MSVILEINGKKYKGTRGLTLYKCLENSGMRLPSACGGKGMCRECRIRVEKGHELLSPRDEFEADLDAGHRLACRAVITADSGVIRLEAFQLESRRIEESGRRAAGVSFTLNPPCRVRGNKVFLDSREVDDFKGSVFGAILDIGTSTVVLRLADLESGEIVFADAFANSQGFAGGDVMSRIAFAGDQGQDSLQQALVAEINQVITLSGIPADRIYEVVVAANPTMRDLFMGFDVSGLGRKPFYSCLEAEKIAGKRDSTAAVVPALSNGMIMNPRGRIYGLPLPGCHVGGDIAAGILASGLARDERNSVLLDLGTNSEIVVRNGERIVTASCPAGPAFEGGETNSGMPGIPGAVEAVKILPENTILLKVIGNRPPIGFCGSGLISLLGEMFRFGLINDRGRFAQPHQGEPSGPDARSCSRTTQVSGEVPPGYITRQYSFEAPDGAPKRMVISEPERLFIDEKDISLLLQAKAAITSGLIISVRSCALEMKNIDVFYLAGAFGKYLDLDSACAAGILPFIPVERFSVLGNTSIEGAEMAMLSVEARLDIEKAVEDIVHLELETEPDFYDLYTDSCLLGTVS